MMIVIKTPGRTGLIKTEDGGVKESRLRAGNTGKTCR